MVDVAEGMTAARDRVRDKIAINPASVDGQLVVEKDYINFDIAVTVSETLKHRKGKSMKAGATISVIAANADGAKEESRGASSEKISRVSFRVPVYYGAIFKKEKQ